MVRNKASEVGRGQVMEGLGAPAKESRFHFQLNTNSLEGLNGLKRPLQLQRMDRGRQEFGEQSSGKKSERWAEASSDGALEDGFKPLSLTLKAVGNHDRVFNIRIFGAAHSHLHHRVPTKCRFRHWLYFSQENC